MAQHKWHKEIKAWADGAEIEHRWLDRKKNDDWDLIEPNHDWTLDCFEYRIKPQPKEPQYLYLYSGYGVTEIQSQQAKCWDTVINQRLQSIPYIGKIKLEQDDAE